MDWLRLEFVVMGLSLSLGIVWGQSSLRRGLGSCVSELLAHIPSVGAWVSLSEI